MRIGCKFLVLPCAAPRRQVPGEAVKAKLTVTGSARKPQLEVSADPTMSQTQALSYLVTGKPLNEVGSGEGDVVQSAARSLEATSTRS